MLFSVLHLIDIHFAIAFLTMAVICGWAFWLYPLKSPLRLLFGWCLILGLFFGWWAVVFGFFTGWQIIHENCQRILQLHSLWALASMTAYSLAGAFYLYRRLHARAISLLIVGVMMIGLLALIGTGFEGDLLRVCVVKHS